MPKRRLHVYLDEAPYRTLEDLASQVGVSQSEMVRRAIALYRMLRELRAQGGHVALERSDGTVRQLVEY